MESIKLDLEELSLDHLRGFNRLLQSGLDWSKSLSRMQVRKQRQRDDEYRLYDLFVAIERNVVMHDGHAHQQVSYKVVDRARTSRICLWSPSKWIKTRLGSPWVLCRNRIMFELHLLSPKKLVKRCSHSTKRAESLTVRASSTGKVITKNERSTQYTTKRSQCSRSPSSSSLSRSSRSI